MRVVVVGNGMAGARLAEELRRRGEDVSITVLGDEPHPAYNRVLLSAVVGGSMSADLVRLQDEQWAARAGVTVRLGAPVAALDRAGRTVSLADGSTVDYDALVLATGARPWIPPTEGLVADDGSLADGALAFRTLDDCARILAACAPGARVAVVGGGLLGLEAARGLAARGCQVTVVHPVGHLMERQLDRGAGQVLAATLAAHGIEFRLGVQAAGYVPGYGLKLDDGTHLAADVVVVSAGVLPRTELARAAGLAVDRGVLVDDALRTSDPAVHAIGDCAQHPGTAGGLVQSAWEQAAVLADLLTGADPAARYRGTPMVVRLKARDVDLAALGDTLTGVDADDAEVLCLQDRARGRYAKLVVRDERVAGAIVLGLPEAAAVITHFYDNATPVPADRLALLLGRLLPGAGVPAHSPAELPASAVVCRCNSVTKHHLTRAWRDGARSATALAGTTRATTGCGSCRDQVAGIAEWLARSDAGARRGAGGSGR